jgi:hypothetical protein
MAKRKEYSRGTLKPEGKFTCTNSSCGLVFAQPIKLRNLCEDAEIYDACPRCFTAIAEVDNAPVIEGESSAIADTEKIEVPNEVETRKTEPATIKQCAHGFGFLSKRSRDEKIPDDCLMCENIVKCMTKGMTA